MGKAHSIGRFLQDPFKILSGFFLRNSSAADESRPHWRIRKERERERERKREQKGREGNKGEVWEREKGSPPTVHLMGDWLFRVSFWRLNDSNWLYKEGETEKEREREREREREKGERREGRGREAETACRVGASYKVTLSQAALNQ